MVSTDSTVLLWLTKRSLSGRGGYSNHRAVDLAEMHPCRPAYFLAVVCAVFKSRHKVAPIGISVLKSLLYWEVW